MILVRELLHRKNPLQEIFVRAKSSKKEYNPKDYAQKLTKWFNQNKGKKKPQRVPYIPKTRVVKNENFKMPNVKRGSQFPSCPQREEYPCQKAIYPKICPKQEMPKSLPQKSTPPMREEPTQKQTPKKEPEPTPQKKIIPVQTQPKNVQPIQAQLKEVQHDDKAKQLKKAAQPVPKPLTQLKKETKGAKPVEAQQKSPKKEVQPIKTQPKEVQAKESKAEVKQKATLPKEEGFLQSLKKYVQSKQSQKKETKPEVKKKQTKTEIKKKTQSKEQIRSKIQQIQTQSKKVQPKEVQVEKKQQTQPRDDKLKHEQKKEAQAKKAQPKEAEKKETKPKKTPPKEIHESEAPMIVVPGPIVLDMEPSPPQVPEPDEPQRLEAASKTAQTKNEVEGSSMSVVPGPMVLDLDSLPSEEPAPEEKMEARSNTAQKGNEAEASSISVVTGPMVLDLDSIPSEESKTESKNEENSRIEKEKPKETDDQKCYFLDGEVENEWKHNILPQEGIFERKSAGRWEPDLKTLLLGWGLLSGLAERKADPWLQRRHASRLTLWFPRGEAAATCGVKSRRKELSSSELAPQSCPAAPRNIARKLIKACPEGEATTDCSQMVPTKAGRVKKKCPPHCDRKGCPPPQCPYC